MINNSVIGGYVAADPEVRHFGSGATLAKFVVMTTDHSRGREEVSKIQVEAWGPLAEVAAMYCGKGKQLVVIGKLKSNKSWVYLKADQIQLLGEKRLPLNAQTVAQ